MTRVSHPGGRGNRRSDVWNPAGRGKVPFRGGRRHGKPGDMANQDRDAGGVVGSGEAQDMSVAAAWGWCVAGCLTWWWAVAWIAVRLAVG